MQCVYNVDWYAQAATQLLTAARNGDVATVTRLLTTHGVSVLVNVTDKVSRTFSRRALCLGVCLLRVDNKAGVI